MHAHGLKTIKSVFIHMMPFTFLYLLIIVPDNVSRHWPMQLDCMLLVYWQARLEQGDLNSNHPRKQWVFFQKGFNAQKRCTDRVRCSQTFL